MFPVIDITNLASSASFYSATLQPLGLRYLPSSQDSVSAHPTATYGVPGSSSRSSSNINNINSKNINSKNINNNNYNNNNNNNNNNKISSSSSSPPSSTPPRPVFQVRQVASGGRAPKLSHITLTAPSHAAVKEAYAFALRSSPDTNDPADPSRCRPPETRLVVSKSGERGERGERGGGDARSEANHGRDHQNNSNKSVIKVSSGTTTTTINVATTGTTSLSPHGVDETRARVSDPDGNIMDLVYRPPHGYASNRHYAGSALRRTMSTDDEASRVLNWNYGGAGAGAGPRSPVAAHTLQQDADEPYTLTRRVTTTTYESPDYEPTVVSPRQAPSGTTTGSVVSTLLGVAAGAAAGAALTYGVVSRSRAPPQDAPAAAERAPPPAYARRATYPDQWPAAPRRGGSGDDAGRYVDVERTVAKVRYPEDYPRTTVVGSGGGGGRSDYDNGRRPRPEYIARYSQVGASRPREAEEVLFGSGDRRSRAPSAAGRSPMSSSARTRSEASGPRRPLMLTERGEHRGGSGGGSSNHHDGGTYVSSRSKHPPIVQRSYTYNVSPGGGSGSSFTANDDDDDDDRTYVSSGRGRRLSHSGGAPMVVPVIASPPMHSRTVMGRGGMVKAAPGQVKVTVTPRSSAGRARHRSRSRAGTYVTETRGMPVPVRSVSGGWDDYDDHRRAGGPQSDSEDDGGLQSDSEDDDSIVPEDSISCVGSRRPPSTYFGSRR